jgi:hypothetical protein
MEERKIIISLITSTEYCHQIRSVWDVSYLESATAKRIATWCWEYYDQYKQAPGRNIESIFNAKRSTQKIPPDIAEEIQEDIFPSLSEEYEREDFNLEYMLSETQKYFSVRHLTIHRDTIDALIDTGDIAQAEHVACAYRPVVTGGDVGIDLSDDTALVRIEKAFNSTNQVLIEYPRQIGSFWNNQMVRGAFVALMASEKRGKTFWLLDLAIRACQQGRNVAFFQAGDMTEDQQLMRICIYLCQKSSIHKYCQDQWQPVRDCIYNQLNMCRRPDRLCSFGVFEGYAEDELKTAIQLSDLIAAYEENPEYTPCAACDEYEHNRWGVPWVRSIKAMSPLTVTEAQDKIREFFITNQRKFKLSSHANGTLSVRSIKTILGMWEKQNSFVPDVIIVDYADLLTGDTKEFRHLQNEIWKSLRGLSQEKGQPLVITATQADADSYDRNRLSLKNFSEDKRKYAHVTAMYGLNQDPEDREKRIGLMRINEIVIREGDFANINEVTVLQNLKRGRPFLGSYW